MRHALFAVLLCGGCASDPDTEPSSSSNDGGITLGDDPSFVDADLPDADKRRVDGGFLGPDGGVLRADRFVTKIVSFEPGTCAGFGTASMPDVVLGPPVGAGDLAGSFDVVSLGMGGEIVVSFEPNAIVDGPGVDFIVFENAFYASGNPAQPAADPGEVSVSDDGVTWAAFPCDAPPASCAGYKPVYSAPSNGISPVDPATAGGDHYDLATLGIAKARFVRIRDRATRSCDGIEPKPTNAGFDLDAIAIVNAETP